MRSNQWRFFSKVSKINNRFAEDSSGEEKVEAAWGECEMVWRRMEYEELQKPFHGRVLGQL